MGDSEGRPDRFRTTRWSLVEAAGDSNDPGSQEALARLCEDYWPPVYSYVRGRGNDPETSQDLTQGFFAQLLERKTLKRIKPEGGKFRAYLLTCVKHFLANERAREQARKRGGEVVMVPLDLAGAERLHRMEESADLTPEQAFEQRWALLVLRRTLSRLEKEMLAGGAGERFQHLRPFLIGGEGRVPYRAIADELGSSEGAIKVAVHRLRRRFGDLLRDVVAQTLNDPAAVDDEILFLRRVLRA